MFLRQFTYGIYVYWNKIVIINNIVTDPSVTILIVLLEVCPCI